MLKLIGTKMTAYLEIIIILMYIFKVSGMNGIDIKHVLYVKNNQSCSSTEMITEIETLGELCY